MLLLEHLLIIMISLLNIIIDENVNEIFFIRYYYFHGFNKSSKAVFIFISFLLFLHFCRQIYQINSQTFIKTRKYIVIGSKVTTRFNAKAHRSDRQAPSEVAVITDGLMTDGPI